MAYIANPWSDWNSIQEAEAMTGFSFGLPEVIADRFTATAFRTMNNELIEVIYRYEDLEIRVRKQKGEDQDISGDYNQYDACVRETVNAGSITTYRNSKNNAVKQLISYKGFSWSITAPDGFSGDSHGEFAKEIFAT